MTFQLTFPPAIAPQQFTSKNDDLHHRMHMERFVVWNMIQLMYHEGWRVVWVHDGEERVPVNPELKKSVVDAMETVFSVDESTVFFSKDGRLASAFIVLGNSGPEVIACCSTNCPLEDIDGDEWCEQAARMAFLGRQWQPIATCPREGYFLAYDPALKRPMVAMWRTRPDRVISPDSEFGDEEFTLWTHLPTL